jgi:hypothetical protein
VPLFRRSIPEPQRPVRVKTDWDERAWLVQADLAASQDADRAILTLSSGALAISLVFVHDVAPTHPAGKAWLVAAWVLFAVSILVTLVSYKTSRAALRAEILRIDHKADRTHPTCWGYVTSAFNWLSALCLVSGVATLLVFAAKNI